MAAEVRSWACDLYPIRSFSLVKRGQSDSWSPGVLVRQPDKNTIASGILVLVLPYYGHFLRTDVSNPDSLLCLDSRRRSSSIVVYLGGVRFYCGPYRSPLISWCFM